MKKVIVRGQKNVYFPKDEYIDGTVEGIVEKLNAYNFVNVEVIDDTEEDSAFVDFMIYAVGESEPMANEMAEYISDAINELGFKLNIICTMQNNKPGAWTEEV